MIPTPDRRTLRRRLAPVLDEAWRQERLAAQAPGLLLSALHAELGDMPGADAAPAAELAAILARRLGREPAAVPPGPVPDLRPWHGQPGLGGELLEEILARLVPQAARDGQVFTPWPLARHLAGLLEPAPGQRWLDPAAGAGIFLQAVATWGAEPTSCSALEPDPVASWLGKHLTPGAAWRDGDALAPWERLPADWRGGFDRVILNPPFRNGVERRDPAWTAFRQELKGRFASAVGPFDLYVPFVERALDFLRPGGRLGLLLPGAWLAAGFGRALRRHLAEHALLLRLQHAPGIKLFPRADFELHLLLLERRAPGRAAPEPELLVERLDRGLSVRESFRVPQDDVRELVVAGWGPLLCPPARRRRQAATAILGDEHPVAASLCAAEFYSLQVREDGQPGHGDLLLLSSGAIEPFHHTWDALPVRFRGARLRRPVVRSATLSLPRREQVARPRVLIANLSRRLEALAVAPDTALGVVNVIQVECADMERAAALAAWLNSAPLQEWVRTWHDPLRMNGQLSLSRGLVRALPAPPDPSLPSQARDARRLAELGCRLAELAAAGAPREPALLEEVDAIAAFHLPLDVDPTRSR